MSTVRSIAKKAGVSITTVSRVLNNHPRVSNEVRERVLAAANESRYVPSVGRKSTTNIAFMYTGELTLGSPFDAALMRGMALGMEEYSYDLMVLDARRARLPKETFSQMFMRKGIKGVVLRTTQDTLSIGDTIANEGFPCVMVGARSDNPNTSYIYSDSRSSSLEAIEYLIGLGHQRIAICLNVVDDSDHVDRYEAYKTALEINNIDFDPKLVLRAPARRDGGEQLIKRIMTMPQRPTAVFITDPMTTIGALSQARRMNVDIPKDLSVVGFDDSESRYTVFPEVTSVCQDAIKIGRDAFTVLHDRIESSNSEKTINESIHAALTSWFEIHESTCAVTEMNT
ncbi:HTH-type transcriptional repressor CytR [Poriferisphaera corsica]|uniref:HTH-type transcriptional repressor CytR n=1 Tax=Poriferisphaera corsica TaxID=2528020 RepID=A0A517YTC9_9BACT|nr:LacI family DNA-binding transcriptional regulator [Poriferisphaera corsica]QDU33474.1 HTH-type transcriptional repressor CytR [Poriferisphaera corsica]